MAALTKTAEGTIVYVVVAMARLAVTRQAYLFPDFRLVTGVTLQAFVPPLKREVRLSVVIEPPILPSPGLVTQVAGLA